MASDSKLTEAQVLGRAWQREEYAYGKLIAGARPSDTSLNAARDRIAEARQAYQDCVAGRPPGRTPVKR